MKCKPWHTKRTIGVSLFLLCYPFFAGHADTSSRSQVRILRHSIEQELIPSESSVHLRENNVKEPQFSKARLQIVTRIPGFGVARIRFDRQYHTGITPTFTYGNRIDADVSGVTLLRGKVRRGKNLWPVAGSIYFVQDTPVLFISFVAKRRENALQELYRLEVPLSARESLPRARLERSSDPSAKLPGGCMAELREDKPAPTHNQRSLSPGHTRAAVPNIYLSLDGDVQLFNMLGFNSNNVMASIFNEAQTLYQQQLGFVLNLARINTYPQYFFGSSDPANKLDTFINFTQSQPYFGVAHAYHLITGESMAGGSVLGRAYIAELCVRLHMTMGVNTFTGDGRTPFTFAHELGHNFGADHDESKPETLMFPNILVPPQTQFSQFSKNVILNHVAQNGPGCVFPPGEVLVVPSPSLAPSASATTVPSPRPSPPPTVDNSPVSISFSAELSRAGDFVASTSLNRGRADCTVRVRGGTNTKKLLSKGKILAEYSGNPAGVSRRANVDRKARSKTKSGKRQKSFLQAEVVCTNGESAASEVLKIAPQSVKPVSSQGKKAAKAVSLGKWFKLLQDALS